MSKYKKGRHMRRLLFIGVLCIASLLFGMAVFPQLALSSNPLGHSEAKICLGCHSLPNMVKTFIDRDKISVQISEKDFKGTVHSFLSCTNCHTDISLDKHPSAAVRYSSKLDFSLHVSKSCRRCHTDAQLMANPIHRNVVKRADSLPCSACHGSHSIKKIAEWERKVNDTQYCLTCHSQDLSTTVNNEIHSLFVNVEDIRKSVHSNLMCTDCHSAFSKEKHPLHNFRNKRERSIAISSETCRRCHSDKYVKFQDSIHYNALKKGNLDAPVCTDCHGAHSAGPKAMLETMSGTPCIKCHEAAFKDFQSSVHGKAMIADRDVAIMCSSCHFSHETKPVFVSQASREANASCIECHKEAVSVHERWLPRTEAHFDAINCVVCHVPEAGSAVYLNIIDSSTGTVVNRDMIEKLLGDKYKELAASDNISGRQIWDIYQELRKAGLKVSITGMMGPQLLGQSHGIVPKSEALKQCKDCHSKGSGLFDNVAMTFIGPDGKEDILRVSSDVLNSPFSILPLSQFYVYGSTRIILLDYIGAFMIIAGASAPIVHITARIISRRKMKKGG